MKRNLTELIQSVPGIVSTADTMTAFRSNVNKLKRERRQIDIQIGERGTLDFSTDDPTIEIVDFTFITINPFLEIPKEPSSS